MLSLLDICSHLLTEYRDALVQKNVLIGSLGSRLGMELLLHRMIGALRLGLMLRKLRLELLLLHLLYLLSLLLHGKLLLLSNSLSLYLALSDCLLKVIILSSSSLSL